MTGKLAGIVVVDFDGEQGRRLMEKWGINPHVRTGSGGFHCYLRHPNWHVRTLNAKTGNVSWPWPGLDIRGDGGFAVLLGRNGNGPYEQLRDLIPEPFDVLPREVRMFLRSHGTEDMTQDQQIRTRPLSEAPLDRVDSGRLVERALAMARRCGRNNAGFWLACQLRDNNYSVANAAAVMRDYRSRVAPTNTKGKVEPYTKNEMNATLREAYSRPARSPWKGRNTRPHDGPCRATAPLREPRQPGNGDSSSRKDPPEQREDAKDPENLDLHVGHTCDPLVEHPRVPLSKGRHARLPIEVLTDPRLESRDVRVYGALSLSCWPADLSGVGNGNYPAGPVVQNA